MALAIKENAPIKDWEAFKIDIEKLKKASKQATEEASIAFARSFCRAVVKNIWKSTDRKKRWKCREVGVQFIVLDFATEKLAKELAEYLLMLPIMQYAYLLGSVYTMLLPSDFRANNGVFYTPPEIAERLLDIIAAEGADWAKHTVLDPACGGGAFLVTVANRMLGDYRIKCLSARKQLEHIESHLAGIEIDRFAAWLTLVLLDILTYQEAAKAGRRLKGIIKVKDTIKYATKETKRYNVVVGNPPYGRVTLDDELRQTYSRSLFGHANLYGLFYDAALRLKTPNGLIGFVSPTSFTGGQYFGNLRNLLMQEAPPLVIDFISDRADVFDKVLQETCLVVLGRNAAKSVTTNRLNIEQGGGHTVERVGNFKLAKGTHPWIIAREQEEAELVNAIRTIKTTIDDYGYKISTGQLVWNRHKNQLMTSPEKGVKPIIWAEAIIGDGSFSFDYQTRSDKQYIQLLEKQDFLVTNKECVLIQRTTAKEQNRRLLTCVIPQSFLDEWGGAVVENHVNIAYAIGEKPSLSPAALSLLLNSQVVDRVFRCLSGSVAVSASELHAIPLPPVKKLAEIERLIATGMTGIELSNNVERIITKAYGMGVKTDEYSVAGPRVTKYRGNTQETKTDFFKGN